MKNKNLQTTVPLSMNCSKLMQFVFSFIFSFFSLSIAAQVVCNGAVNISADPTTCSAIINYATILLNPPTQPAPVTIFDSQNNTIFSGFLPTSLSNVTNLSAYRVEYDGGNGNGGCSTNLTIQYTQGCISSPPTILKPSNGAIMDNGCSNGSNAINWHFEWTAVQGAIGYFINVRNVNIPFDIINFRTDNLTPPTAYDAVQPYPDLYGYQSGWECKARAVFSDGSFSNWSPIVNFTLESVNTDCPSTITSARDGDWSTLSTWIGGVVPTANDDVIINHNVTIPATGTSACKKLTINGIVNNTTDGGFLQCSGNMTISSTGAYNGGGYIFPPAYSGIYSGGGVLAIAADKTMQGNSTGASISPANNKILAVNGGAFDGFVILAGRMLATNGATVNLKGGDYIGSSDPTPQYIVEADNTSTVTIGGGTYLIRSNGSQAHFSPNVILTSATPTCPSGATFNNLNGGGDYTFGATDRDQTMASFYTLNGSSLNSVEFKRMKVGSLSFYTSGSNPKSITSNNSKFASMSIFGNLTTLKGNFELVNNCSGGAPYMYVGSGVTADNTFSITANTTDTAVIDLSGVTLNPVGGFSIQNGKVVVKGGTLDLSNVNVTGLSNTQYFITQPNFNNTQQGKVLLPAISSSSNVVFNVGLSVPNGSGPPRSVYAPVNIVSNVGTTNVTVSLQTLTAPAGYVAPSIKWDIASSAAGSDLKITLTWPPSVESTQFAANRNVAKIFHFNSTTNVWEQLTTEPLVTNPDGSFSLTVNHVTSFSPFAVMVPTSVLSADLVKFSAKANANQTELNWQTASEINVKNFDIEKSLDGQKFEKIAEVKANNTPSVYSAFDNQFSTSAYYRLKINDLEGTNSFSKSVFLEKNAAKSIKISRNTEGGIFIETNDIIESVVVTNNIGEVLKTTRDNRFGLTNLPTGIYIISVKTNKAVISQKVLNF